MQKLLLLRSCKTKTCNKKSRLKRVKLARKGVKMTLQQITIEIPGKVLLAEKMDAESFGREILVLA
jgi:hypothetical protein